VKRHRVTAVLAALMMTAGFGASRIALGQDDAEDQTVGRVAFLQGTASYNRGDDPDDWQPAQPNFPLTTGDHFWTSTMARAEIQTLSGTVFLAPETDLSVLRLSVDSSQLSIGSGTATFRIHRLAQGETFEVATPNSAVTFPGSGHFRIDVDEAGNTRVSVFRGTAVVAAAGGQVRLQTRDAMRIDGIDEPHYDVTDVPGPDSWDQWVEGRARRYREVRGPATYPDIVGIDDLDRYGRWQEIPRYGRVWTPASVASDWIPYRTGSWVWRDPWGWTWVSTEPWGWAPYHYGRWVVWSSRWYWVPDPPATRVRWAPAYVSFVGGGPGWSVSGGLGGGFVGWFPLAPREPFLPWWRHGHADATVSVTNVTYVNRTHVTVVKQETFVSGAPVGRNVVRDREIVRKVESAPILRGPPPVTPSHSSLHVAPAKTGTAPRPPEQVLRRSVVSRMPPPPAPKPFHPLYEKDSPPPGVGAPHPTARTDAGSAGAGGRQRPAEKRAAPPPRQSDVHPAPPPVTRTAPPARREDVHPAPTPATRAAPPARRADSHPAPAPVTKAVSPERRADVRPAGPGTAAPVHVRPAQAEKVELKARGEAPQRRKVEPLKTEAPAKKKEGAPEKKKPEGKPDH
jgi:hypothetical protein